MNTTPQPNSSEIPAEEQQLLAGVEPRIFRSTWVLGVVGAAVCWLAGGPSWAAGFAIGAALSALSFHWMKSAIHTVADAAISSRTPSAQEAPRKPSSGAIARFVLRYALIAVAAYVIFRGSAVSLAAFFAGLFVAIAAVLVEIGYQIYLTFRRT